MATLILKDYVLPVIESKGSFAIYFNTDFRKKHLQDRYSKHIYALAYVPSDRDIYCKDIVKSSNMRLLLRLQNALVKYFKENNITEEQMVIVDRKVRDDLKDFVINYLKGRNELEATTAKYYS